MTHLYSAGVYVIECIPMNRVYVGVYAGERADGLARALARQRYDLSHDRHGNRTLQADYLMLGPERFRFTVVERCPTRDLARWQAYYLAHYARLYNRTSEQTS